ncbi:MAG: DciA family protein [Candidatus Jacksonbacteria bacterium]
MFHTLKTLIPGFTAKYKIASLIEAVLICEETDKIIKDIVDESALQNTKTVYLKDNVLTVKTDSATIISELKLYESAILESLQAKFPKVKINGLRFLVE